IAPRTQHATSGICATRRNRRCRDHLDERLKAVSARQVETSEILKNLVAPMRFEHCPEAHRARVVECAIFATSNSLKSQVTRNHKSPFSNVRAITSELCSRRSEER